MQLHNDKITTLQTAYLDHTINSNLAYRPEFISNNYKLGKKVLVSIEEELQRCEEFFISVAFITKSGITPLLQTLKDLEQRNIPGKILMQSAGSNRRFCGAKRTRCGASGLNL